MRLEALAQTMGDVAKWGWVVSAGVLIAACAQPGPVAPPSAGAVQLANPASTYCLQRGGQLALRNDAAGNAVGLCTLPDGTVIEEWALFRRDHPTAPAR